MPQNNVDLCTDEYYHLYNRGNNREPIFYDRENYLFFLRRMWKYLLPSIDVVAYCLMPTHYHLLVLVQEAEAVSRAMQRFSISYTKAMNKRFDRVGSLFQGTFQAKHINENRYLMHLSRYIHLNPVSAGLVKSAEEWEFSSYRDYIGERDGQLPQSAIVLSQFESPDRYKDFVEDNLFDDQEIIADFLFDES
jgi:REP element-mobilizing transposase RayT